MKKTTGVLLILAILLFHVFISWRVLRESEVAREADERARISYAISYFRLFFSHDAAFPPFSARRDSTRPLTKFAAFCSLPAVDKQSHPHLVEVVEALAWRAIGYPAIENIDSMILLSNALFLGLLLFSVYGIGCVLYGRRAAFLAAFLVAFFPMVFGHSRVAMLDLPSASLVSLAIYLLLKTRYLRSFLYSILCGLALGFAGLTKETAFVFICAPFLFYILKSLSSHRDKRAILCVCLVVFFAGAVAGTVYLQPTNQHALQKYFGMGGTSNLGIRNPIEHLYYLRLYPVFVGPFVGALLLPPFFFYLLNLRRRNKLLFLWLFVPLLMYSSLPNKTLRYLIPLLPAFALMIAGELQTSFRFKRIKTVYGFLLVSLLILQYAFFHAGFFRGASVSFPILDGGLRAARRDEAVLVGKELARIFRQEVRSPGKEKRVFFLFHSPLIYDPLRTFALLYRLPMSISCPAEGDPYILRKFHSDPTQRDWSRVLMPADYVVDRTGIKCGESETDKQQIIARNLQESFAKHRNKFTLVAELEFGRGERISVYKKLSIASNKKVRFRWIDLLRPWKLFRDARKRVKEDSLK